ncbi:hypothetical protein H257_01925 [Aphanomyces astaci]|uniref:Serine aminopeptidase S33 domain-containing protein n=1 Tax=Aphanomyces astaci TaxID=112090 RepID=W4H5L0_APHAT|nr:hypothetical protein H257_01925 [Aphanomyces astaci]ETV86881.1 hypothetical protein H257_01925 [Aphanomyces astaci]|eukprot:XP_009823680.1 hypothetical protein H257_01925 [Aphanomyces astaci]
MALPLYVAAAAAVLVPAAGLLHLFGPGHEDASERTLVAPLADEVALQAKFKHETGRLQSQPVRVYTQYYFPKQATPKGVVICLHGIYAHSGGLTLLYENLLNRGYVVGALDFRGFGRSAGRFGYIDVFSNYVDDVLAFLEATRVQFPGQKVFVIGISMGGLVLLHTLLRARHGLIDGAVLHAPPVLLADGVRPPAIVETVCRVLVKVLPKLPAIPTHGAARANSNEVASAVEASKQLDDLFYKGRLRLGTALNMLQATLDIQTQYHKIDTPFVLIHGDNDRVCAYAGSKRLFAAAASTDKQLITIPQGEHNLLKEPERFRRQYLHHIGTWLDGRCQVD